MTQKVKDIADVLEEKSGAISENEYILSKIEAMKHERNLINNMRSYFL